MDNLDQLFASVAVIAEFHPKLKAIRFWQDSNTLEFHSSVINSILVSEDSGNADTVTVTLTNGSDVFSLFKVAAVGANATVELLTHSLVLQGGEILKVQAATGNRLHVVASIQEYAQNRSTTAL